MAADVLATQGARALATMILTYLTRVNSVPRMLRVKLVLFQYNSSVMDRQQATIWTYDDRFYEGLWRH